MLHIVFFFLVFQVSMIYLTKLYFSSQTTKDTVTRDYSNFIHSTESYQAPSMYQAPCQGYMSNHDTPLWLPFLCERVA